MADIDAKTVMDLRRRTGAGMMDCKKALQESGGDVQRAIDVLRAKGLKSAAKRSGRSVKEGYVGTYLHHTGKLGAMVEVLCETDFVARNSDFRALVANLCKHVAAQTTTPPLYVSRDEVPEAAVLRERAIYEEQVGDKPPQIRDKIVQGKLDSYYRERVLLEQVYSMDDTNRSVAEVVEAAKAKLGENVVVRRFARFDVADELE
jgi:elongation factor Ts